MTFFPNSLTTNGLWFGCDLSESDTRGSGRANANVIRRRLSSYDGEAFHPMLLPTILADFERDRLVRLIREIDNHFIQKVFDLQYRESQQQQLALPRTLTDLSAVLKRPKRTLTEVFKIPARKGTDMNFSGKAESSATPSIPLRVLSPAAPSPDDKEPSIQLFIKISHLRNGLSNWRTQLLKMIEHVEELQRIGFGIDKTTNAADGGMDATLNALNLSGLRIRGRLQELVDEYDEFMRKCTHIMEGMMLATQLVGCIQTWKTRVMLSRAKELAHIGREDARSNQQIAAVNLEVAKLARRDGNLMKSIALLGMIFLPGTFVAVSTTRMIARLPTFLIQRIRPFFPWTFSTGP